MLSSDHLLNEIEVALKQAQFDRALKYYYQLFTSNQEFFDFSIGIKSQSRKVHIQNAANLARRNGYEQFKFLESVSERLKLALAQFLGLMPGRFDNDLQRPNFFYIPNLPSQNFFSINEVEGAADLIEALSTHTDLFRQLSLKPTEKYVAQFDNLPDDKAWQEIGEKWYSIHLMKAGEFTEVGHSMPSDVKNLFNHDLIADCPPHAPEAFISTLNPGAYIPPHFGISNCKLTVHIPIDVNEDASITVAKETVAWREGTQAILFDDSFLHSAINESKRPRSVLIFDIWNPSLNASERAAIRKFMPLHNAWSNEIGSLASVDRQFF